MKKTGVAVGAATLVAVAYGAGMRRERQARDSLLASLIGTFDSDGFAAAEYELDGLPVPVRRYLRFSAPEGSGAIRLAHLRQEGKLRTGTRSDRWMAFTAEQRVAPSRASFVWNARVSVAPAVHIRVIDSLVEGRGAGRVSLLSAFPVASDGATPEMNSGALHRFLAEAVWYPTALRPSRNLSWTPIADHKALATLAANGVTVSLEFSFGRSGEIVGIYSPGRWGRFEGGYRKEPWEGHFSDYVTVQGFSVPRRAEVGWYADGVWSRVWEGALKDATYEGFPGAGGGGIRANPGCPMRRLT